VYYTHLNTELGTVIFNDKWNGLSLGKKYKITDINSIAIQVLDNDKICIFYNYAEFSILTK